MADEEKNEATQSEAGTETTGAENESEQKESQEKEDFEAKYKAQQAEYQKLLEERDQVKETLDLVYPAIDFAKLQGGEEQEEEKPPVTRDDLQVVESRLDNKLHTLDFRQKYPELREYEHNLVGPALARIRARNPRMSIDKVLDKAAEETKAFLDAEREKGREEANKKKAAAAAASGLGSVTTSSTKKEEVESQGESYEEYMARRKKESAKARGLI